jgi:hypothetical protein
MELSDKSQCHDKNWNEEKKQYIYYGIGSGISKTEKENDERQWWAMTMLNSQQLQTNSTWFNKFNPNIMTNENASNWDTTMLENPAGCDAAMLQYFLELLIVV